MYREPKNDGLLARAAESEARRSERNGRRRLESSCGRVCFSATRVHITRATHRARAEGASAPRVRPRRESGRSYSRRVLPGGRALHARRPRGRERRREPSGTALRIEHPVAKHPVAATSSNLLAGLGSCVTRRVRATDPPTDAMTAGAMSSPRRESHGSASNQGYGVFQKPRRP